jgi:hypothetical protein
MLDLADSNAACAVPFFANCCRLDFEIELAKTSGLGCIFKNAAVKVSLLRISNGNTTEFRNRRNHY